MENGKCMGLYHEQRLRNKPNKELVSLSQQPREPFNLMWLGQPPKGMVQPFCLLSQVLKETFRSIDLQRQPRVNNSDLGR